jgi:Glycosyltransferase family 87
MTLSPAWVRRSRVGVIGALANLFLYNVYQVIQSPNQIPDFFYFFAFARIPWTDGPQHLYDPATQQHAEQSLMANAPFYEVINPPPFAWLLAPLMNLPYSAALWLWTAAMIAALAASALLLAPPGLYQRLLFTAMWLGFLPAYLVVVSAPVAPLLILSLAITWKLLRGDHPTAAGVVLALALVKPTVAVLVPFALLAAGHRRMFLSWLASAVILVVASMVWGVSISQYLAMGAHVASGSDYSLRWSLVPIVGDGLPWVLAALLITALTVSLAWWMREGGPEVAITLGVMGSILINHHMTPGDLMLFLVPIWLMLRSHDGLLGNALIGAAWFGAWLSLIFTGLAIVVAAAMPLVMFVGVLRGRAARRLSALDV